MSSQVVVHWSTNQRKGGTDNVADEDGGAQGRGRVFLVRVDSPAHDPIQDGEEAKTGVGVGHVSKPGPNMSPRHQTYPKMAAPISGTMKGIERLHVHAKMNRPVGRRLEWVC